MGPFRVRFGSVSGPFRVRFGVLGGVGVRSGRGASVRAQHITSPDICNLAVLDPYQKEKYCVYANFFGKFAQAPACFPVTSGAHQKLFRKTCAEQFLHLVDFCG